MRQRWAPVQAFQSTTAAAVFFFEPTEMARMEDETEYTISAATEQRAKINSLVATRRPSASSPFGSVSDVLAAPLVVAAQLSGRQFAYCAAIAAPALPPLRRQAFSQTSLSLYL